MRHSRKTMIGLQPDTAIPKADGRQSGVRERPRDETQVVFRLVRMKDGTIIAPRVPVKVVSATPHLVAAGVVCFILAALALAFS